MSYRIIVCPLIVIIAIPIRIFEFCVKFSRTNSLYALPYGLVMAIPYIVTLTLVFSLRLLYLVFTQACYLIHKRHSKERLDVNHKAEWINHHWLTKMQTSKREMRQESMDPSKRKKVDIQININYHDMRSDI